MIAPMLPVEFVLVAFEGPDPYAQAGGLATRLAGLTEVLVAREIQTHLIFFGDPDLPATETRADGLLTLHRWGQWISRYHPRGCYDGEEGKLRNLASALPDYLIDRVIAPARARVTAPIVLAEEWQTAPFTVALDQRLRHRGIRADAVLLWNANNPYGFDRIDWPALESSATIMTVSRYMKAILRARGVDSTVVANGIPERLLAKAVAPRPNPSTRPFFFKMARWEPEKGWNQALDAIANLRRRGQRVQLIARSGGPAGRGTGLASAATERGLAVAEVEDPDVVAASVVAGGFDEVDVIDLRFPVSEDLARLLYATADAVLANSVSEPFGLVGLEAMAAGGVVFTGGTGEDYAEAEHNAVVLETTDPAELVARAERLWGDPAAVALLRDRARSTARLFTWNSALDQLLALAVSPGPAAGPGLPARLA